MVTIIILLLVAEYQIKIAEISSEKSWEEQTTKDRGWREKGRQFHGHFLLDIGGENAEERLTFCTFIIRTSLWTPGRLSDRLLLDPAL